MGERGMTTEKSPFLDIQSECSSIIIFSPSGQVALQNYKGSHDDVPGSLPRKLEFRS